MRESVPLVNTTRTTLQNDGSLIIHPYKREDEGKISNNRFYSTLNIGISTFQTVTAMFFLSESQLETSRKKRGTLPF